jgi:hypothetical protein
MLHGGPEVFKGGMQLYLYIEVVFELAKHFRGGVCRIEQGEDRIGVCGCRISAFSYDVGIETGVEERMVAVQGAVATLFLNRIKAVQKVVVCPVVILEEVVECPCDPLFFVRVGTDEEDTDKVMQCAAFKKDFQRLLQYFGVTEPEFDQFFDDTVGIFVSDFDGVDPGVFKCGDLLVPGPLPFEQLKILDKAFGITRQYTLGLDCPFAGDDTVIDPCEPVVDFHALEEVLFKDEK